MHILVTTAMNFFIQYLLVLENVGKIRKMFYASINMFSHSTKSFYLISEQIFLYSNSSFTIKPIL